MDNTSRSLDSESGQVLTVNFELLDRTHYDSTDRRAETRLYIKEMDP